MSEGPDAVASEADGVEVVRVEGASHWVQLDRPAVVDEAISRVLSLLGG